MKIARILLFISFSAFLFSCKTMQKIPTYLQNVNDTTGVDVKTTELKIQKNDLLSIQVYSASTKPEISDALYNLPNTQALASGGQQQGGNSSGTSGYLVDAYGNIEYPRIGIMHVEGLTKLQLAEMIKLRINEKDSVLTNPSVIIRFQNLKITVLGEVNVQGVLSIPGERLTVMEAVGLAGGITDYGMKDKVKVIREADGKREIGIIDLSSKQVFESPYYTLMQNDVVLVEPVKRKAQKADQDVALRQAGFIISVITAMAVVVNLFK